MGTKDVGLYAICEGLGVIRVGILGRVQIRIFYLCLIKREKKEIVGKRIKPDRTSK